MYIPIRLRISSGTLRERLCTARADECDQITGARVTLRVCRAVSSEVWERSTSIPSLKDSMRTGFSHRTGTCNGVGLVPVHLLDQFHAEIGEPVVLGWNGLENPPRVGESVVAGVGKRHIPDTEGVVLSKNGERIA
jgi:hypothetical protein